MTLKEAKKLLKEWKNYRGPITKFSYNELIKASGIIAMQQTLDRVKAEHDKYCGNLDEKDGWFWIAKMKILNENNHGHTIR